MSWDEGLFALFALFDELEAQAEAGYADEREAELADRSRAEYQQVTLASRLMASVDHEVTLEVRGVGALSGRLDRVGSGWLLLTAPGRGWVVAQPAVAVVRGASERAVPEVAWSPVTRLGLGSALRRLADGGERCLVHLVDGGRHPGVVRRVGADFIELVDDAGRLVLLAQPAIAAVQSRD